MRSCKESCLLWVVEVPQRRFNESWRVNGAAAAFPSQACASVSTDWAQVSTTSLWRSPTLTAETLIASLQWKTDWRRLRAAEHLLRCSPDPQNTSLRSLISTFHSPLPYWLLVHLLVVPHLALMLSVLHPHLISVLHSLFHQFQLLLVSCHVRELPLCLTEQLVRLLLARVDLLALEPDAIEDVIPLLLPSAHRSCCLPVHVRRISATWARVLPAVGPGP